MLMMMMYVDDDDDDAAMLAQGVARWLKSAGGFGGVSDPWAS